MKHLFPSIVTCAILLATSASSCRDNKNSATDNSGSGPTEVTTLPIAMDLKSATRCFMIEADNAPTSYLNISTTAEWPRTIGTADLTVLQQYIIRTMFPEQKNDTASTDIDRAIRQFVNDAAVYELGNRITPIDTIPTQPYLYDYYSRTQLSMIEISQEMVSYNVASQQFFGGAHPMQNSSPFTFVFGESGIVTLEWLFNPGYEPMLQKVLTTALAAQLDMPENELSQQLLVSSIPVSKTLYIEEGTIKFHYNPYEILPYSYGSIDIAVSPYEVDPLLTPKAKALLIETNN